MFKKKLIRKASSLVAGVVLTLGMGGNVQANEDPVKVGFFLPYSGTFGHLGQGIDNGIRLAFEQAGNKLGGRDIEIVTVPSGANPSNAVSNMQKLISGENVDFVLGPVHSGVAMGALKVARQEGTILVIPNAGLNVATRQLCAPNIFRTSFSNWQPDFSMARPAYESGVREVVTISWRYAAGEEHLGGFEEEFERLGGKVVKRILIPFPSVDFQVPLTDIASIDPDAVYAFFGGGGAVKFLKDYAAAGLNENVQLLSTGFLTDSIAGLGDIANGVRTTLHWNPALDNEYNRAFIQAYKERFNEEASIYSVQGYDAGQLLVKAMAEVDGNTTDQEALVEAMGKVTFDDSPRGPWKFSKAHNPIQNMYLQEVQNGQNVVIGVAAEALEDPATGCAMAQ